MQKYKAIKVEHQWQIIEGDTLIAIAGCDNSAIPSFDVPEEWEEDEVYKLADEYANNEDYCYTDPAKEKYKWTDEDMEKMFELGWLSGNGNEQANYKGWIEYLKQPKEYEVELEEENSIPKITNNKVKILSYKLL